MTKEYRKPGFGKRYRYWFDNMMSRGAIAVILWLAIISFVIVMVVSAAVILFNFLPEGQNDLGFFEAAWISFAHVVDAGAIGADFGWTFRLIMLIAAIGGLFIFSALIGIINNAIDGKIQELRKGRSEVIESDHTLILGWSSKIFSIISELTIANENKKKPRIVVLADKDKVEMEDEIKTKVSDTRNTRVICRSGSPIDLDDLKIVNPHGAHSIIILAPESDDPDISVIKTVLAITGNSSRKKGLYNIVSEMKELKNLQVAEMVGKDEATFILNKDIISRMIVQTSRQAGLSVVFTELLDFDGDEIYFKKEPAIVGKTFKDVLFMYNNSTVMGIFSEEQKAKVNPPMDTIIEEGDSLITISEDDDTILLSGMTDYGIDESLISHAPPAERKVERTLVLGWNNGGYNFVKEMDSYVVQGSFIKVVADIDESKLNSISSDLAGQLVNQKLEFVVGSTTDRDLLESLDIPSYDHIVVLCYEQLGAQEADAKTLVTLLHLRDIAEKAHTRFNIVSEMLDVKNRELATITNADDFIVSDKIISLMLAQLSENRFLKPVFDNLFEAEGSEIYIKPATNYVLPNKETNFYTVLKAAAERNEIPIGYRQFNYAGSADKAYGVVVNPDKSEKIVFEENDQIIVIAED